jgi:steroid 5-alpha reductase family enzyme
MKGFATLLSASLICSARSFQSSAPIALITDSGTITTRPSAFGQRAKPIGWPPVAGKLQRVARGGSSPLYAAPIVLPTLQTIAIACLIPTSLGFYKYEYGVSYGYGTSVAVLAYLMLQKLSQGSIAHWHALALLFYGVRLNLFLLYRELCIPRFGKMRDRIEARRQGKGLPVVSRIPFVVGCAALYAGLASPLFVTSQFAGPCPWVKGCVVTAWVGFIVGALADLQKTFVKAVLGEDTLVKGGLYTWLRHPNYTGELLGWTASFAASVLVAASSWSPSLRAPMAASALGWMGIAAVLAMAASSLERKQRETYELTLGYNLWIQSSWAGPTLGKK